MHRNSDKGKDEMPSKKEGTHSSTEKKFNSNYEESTPPANSNYADSTPVANSNYADTTPVANSNYADTTPLAASNYDESTQQESTQQESTQPSDTEETESEFEKYFKKLKDLGSGVTGGAAIYKYEGNDPALQMICDSNQMVVVKWLNSNPDKHSKMTFANEISNIHNNLSLNNQNQDNRIPNLATFTDGEKKYILVQPVYSDDKNNSATLSAYMLALGHNIYSGPEEQVRLLGSILHGALLAQDKVHDNHLLHLDSGPRNFMIGPNNTVVAIDYGASFPMDEHGNAINPEVFPKLPFYLFDQAAITNQKYTIKTDLFSRKILMMECLASYMGLQEGPEINTKIHLGGLNFRFNNDVICMALNYKNEINSDELRKISQKNDNKAILFRQNGKIQIYGNNDPKTNDNQAWKITELDTNSVSNLQSISFSSNKLNLVRFQNVPRLSDLKKISKKNKNQPILVAHRDNIAQKDQYYLFRYSASKKEWVKNKVDSEALEKYINDNWGKKFPGIAQTYEHYLDYKNQGITYKLDTTTISDDHTLDEFRRMVQHTKKHGNLFEPKPEIEVKPAPAEIDVKKWHCAQGLDSTLGQFSDEERLSRTFNNLKTHALSHDDKDEQVMQAKQVVLKTLDQHEKYLIKMPEKHANAQEYRNSDKISFYATCDRPIIVAQAKHLAQQIDRKYQEAHNIPNVPRELRQELYVLRALAKSIEKSNLDPKELAEKVVRIEDKFSELKKQVDSKLNHAPLTAQNLKAVNPKEKSIKQEAVEQEHSKRPGL